MNLKRNLIATYASQIYAIIINLVMIPLYIRYMGPEAYGLVGFFATLQAWFTLLDGGLTPTMTRETARFHGGASDSLNYRLLVRSLEGVFLSVAVVGGVLLYTGSGYISRAWLKASDLPIVEVQTAVQFMAIIVSLRWMSGLYRGAIGGSERLVWLSGFNTIINTVRFAGVLPVLIFVGISPTIFFKFQFFVAITELVVLIFQAYRIFPSLPTGTKLPWAWNPLKKIVKFSLTIAFTSIVWLLVTQTDKLILSTMLPLAEYGYFSLAVMAAGAVLTISGPVSAAILPKLSKMDAEGAHEDIIVLYRNATRWVCAIALPVACTLSTFAEEILWVWTGDHVIAKAAAPIMKLYVIGNLILVVGAFPYYLQYAKGDLHLHLIGSAILLVLLIPSLVWATNVYGAIGAAWAWLITHALGFVLWIPIVHRRFGAGLHSKWLLADILPMVISASLSAAAFSLTTIYINSQIKILLAALLMVITTLMMVAISSKPLRIKVFQAILDSYNGKIRK